MTMRLYLQRTFVFSFILFFISACTPLFEQKQTDYSHLKQSELNELKVVYENFEQIDKLDAALYLNHKDLSSVINRSFEKFSKAFSRLHSGEFSNVTFDTIELQFVRQQIFSTLGFSFKVNALKRKIHGQIKAKHHFKAGKDEFIIKMHFDEIIIEGIEEVALSGGGYLLFGGCAAGDTAAALVLKIG